MPSQIEIMDEEDTLTTSSKDAESAGSLHPAEADDIDDHVMSRSPTNTATTMTNHKSISLTGTDCIVCRDQATPNSTFRRHYGVICCEACKCFFRRTVQMNRDYKCRFEGNCYVGRTTDNLKQVCQACRFQQCVIAGMKLGSVKRFPRKSKRVDINEGSEILESSTTSTTTSTTASTISTTSTITTTSQLGNKNSKKNKSSKKNKDTSQERNFVIKESSPVPLELDRAQLDCPSYMVGGIILSPKGLNSSHEEELKLSDTDLANVKFKMSPSEAMLYLQSASTSVPQLFKYDSLDNINEKSLGSPVPMREKVAERKSVSGSKNTIGTASSVGFAPIPSTTVMATTSGSKMDNGTIKSFKGCVATPGKRGPRNHDLEENGGAATIATTPTATRKKQCVEPITLGHYQSSRIPSNGTTSTLSTPPITPLTPLTPTHPHSQASSNVNSPDVYSSNNNNLSTYNSPYVTPRGTPAHTPHQSPLPSPTQMMYPPSHHLPGHPVMSHGLPSSSTGSGSGHTSPMSSGVNGGATTSKTTHHHPGNDSNNQGKDSSPSSYQMHMGYPPPLSSIQSSTLTIPGFAPQLHFTPQQQANPGGTIFFNSHTPVPFQVLTSTSILPMMFSAHHPSLEVNGQHLGGTGMSSSKSPFTIVPIPSINRTQPEEFPCESDSTKANDSPEGRRGESQRVPGSSPSSARASPVNVKKFPHFAEAKLEEVLDSLRLRIRSLFTWAKSDVSGFDDLSPLDQKALLRRTVPELVMLGFARGSIAYNDLLLLGRTGQVIRPTNQNSGVASVASVTLQKLVVPLKVLNINDTELALLQEIVLFNPESNGLRNREVVRQYRKSKHLKLMEYTDKSSDDPGRFGELMCLLTPLFEVSTEVTEQLRLEQFVHEGEARIDALLLMSMISGADEIPDENTLDSQI